MLILVTLFNHKGNRLNLTVIRVKNYIWGLQNKEHMELPQNIIGVNKNFKKAILAEFWRGPEDFRRLKLPDFDTISA